MVCNIFIYIWYISIGILQAIVSRTPFILSLQTRIEDAVFRAPTQPMANEVAEADRPAAVPIFGSQVIRTKATTPCSKNSRSGADEVPMETWCSHILGCC